MSPQQPEMNTLPDGTREWRLNGKRHREDGPAVERANGRKEWYLNGQRHRECGPAIEWSDGSKWWYLNGEFHREGGPAIDWSFGGKSWWINGNLHREDGPAIVWSDGSKSWWLNGKSLSEPDYLKDLESRGIENEYTRSKMQVPQMEVRVNGSKAWRLNGLLHREDGPAFEGANGTREWWFNGRRHREDGPAVEWSNGSKWWYLNGKRHREDGPAIERDDGTREWYLNGKALSEPDYLKELESRGIENEYTRINAIKLDVEKAVISVRKGRDAAVSSFEPYGFVNTNECLPYRGNAFVDISSITYRKKQALVAPKFEYSDCRFCEYYWRHGCAHPAHRAKVLGKTSLGALAYLNPNGECVVYRPTLWTRVLRYFGLRKPSFGYFTGRDQ